MAKQQDQVVLVTGCSEGGIGAWYCKILHSRGRFRVYASDVPHRFEAMQSLRDLGMNTLRLDVTSDESVAEAVQQVLGAEGKIDILINNAGLSLIGPLAELPLRSMVKAFDVNLFGALRLIQAVVPSMAARRQGRIINIGSVVGYVPTPWAGSYCCSKAAIHALSDILRVELQPFGIKVVLVAPGSVQSNLGAASGEELKNRRWALYEAFRGAIAERATSSQSQRATRTEVFASAVVDQAVMRPDPPRHFVFGFMAGLFWLLRWSPMWARDLFMKWRFGLLNNNKNAERSKTA